ncbi:hypothetical protein ACFL0M_09210 [Thermodesulfobacteriota bacterium]
MRFGDRIKYTSGNLRQDEFGNQRGAHRNTVITWSIKIFIILIILGVIGYFAYRQIGSWLKRGIDTAIVQERKVWQIEADVLKDKISSLQEELWQHREELVSKEKLLDVFGEDAILIFPGQKINCDELEGQIAAFYRYLDQKDYIKTYKLEKGTSELFQEMIMQLSEKLPVVIFETKDIFTLIRNMAHFYRVLGKNRIKLIKEILKNESEIIESVMATFFTWFTYGDRCKVNIMGHPSLKTLYKYSGFFLNTLAGRNYLFRRNSNVRILINYYSVLILDRANAETLNSHGIDIRPYIDFSIFNMRNRKGLIYQNLYLSELEKLKKKYQM